MVDSTRGARLFSEPDRDLPGISARLSLVVEKIKPHATTDTKMLTVAIALPFAFFAPPTARTPSALVSVSMSTAVPKTFEAALDLAPQLCAALQAGEAPAGLAEFVASSAGARGFFVHYLTNEEYTCADQEDVPAGLSSSLESASPATIEIMLMNVVMSAGTALAHRRAGREEMALSSERTSARAGTLVCTMAPKLPQLRESFGALCQAVDSEFLVEAGKQPVAVDEWVAFLAKWSYDQDQLDLIAAALASMRPSVLGEDDEPDEPEGEDDPKVSSE